MKNLKLFLALSIFLSLLTCILPSQRVEAAQEMPKIIGTSGITVDVATGEIIYANNIDTKAYPASVTKLMTSLLFAENKTKADVIPYTADAYKQPEYSLRINFFNSIKVGDTMSAEDVMKSLLMFSANDSAYMIADSVGGNSNSFIQMMNEKAKALKMNNTNFMTANGLHDPNHYTTAYDLSLLGKAAYGNDWVKEVMNLKSDKVTLSNGLWASVDNRNKLLGKDGCIGGKTGWTSASGRCLVALYERDGRAMVGVVMNSEYDPQDTKVFSDMETIINWSYSAEKKVAITSGTTVETKELQYKPLRFFGPVKTISVPVIVKEDVSYYDNNVNQQETKTAVDLTNSDPWAFSSDTSIGKLTLSQRDYSANYEVYTTITSSDLISANKGLYIISAIAILVAVVFIFIVIRLIMKVSRKGRRRKGMYY